MQKGIERRRVARIPVHIPATVEVIAGAPEGRAMDAGYECVSVPNQMAGQRFEAMVRDISVNGARLSARLIPPLLARISLAFEMPGYGMALAMCIVLWRRGPVFGDPPDGESLEPGEVGFGVLFEAVDLAVRKTIAEMVERSAQRVAEP